MYMCNGLRRSWAYTSIAPCLAALAFAGEEESGSGEGAQIAVGMVVTVASATAAGPCAGEPGSLISARFASVCSALPPGSAIAPSKRLLVEERVVLAREELNALASLAITDRLGWVH